MKELFLAGVFFTSEFLMTFNYSYFFTPSTLIFCKFIFRFHFDYLFIFVKGVRFGIDDNFNNLLTYPYFLPR